MTVGSIGVAVGLAGAIAASRVLDSLVFDVQVRDPFTYVAVAAILVLVALMACVIPARKASRVDPIVALRYEEGLLATRLSFDELFVQLIGHSFDLKQASHAVDSK
jgi:hypothetical protein